MLNINPFLLTDFYKVGHPFQYPDNTTLVYSNLTPRKSRIPGVNHMVFFGMQYFIKEYLIDYFNRNFFHRPKDEVMREYARRIKTSLGSDLPSYEHIAKLHDLGYLPLEIKSLPEGSKVPMRVACMTIKNTLPEYYWLTNFVESFMSATVWQPCTSATIAHEYRKIFDKYAEETGVPSWFPAWQGHDFSFRGMSSIESAMLSGMGHLLSFTGTDTIPAIDGLEKYYNANADTEMIGGSVPATEHSVMCCGGPGGELDTLRRLITKVYPSGIASIVSDTWNLWTVLTEYLPQLKSEIMARDGKIVIRPDSGNPADIICGDPNGKTENERKGAIQLLWEVFGGTMTDKGYKMLDSHIGLIYGDSISLKIAEEICSRLKANGFATQTVFGIGSYTYQMNTRDTFGTAMKATYVIVDGEGRAIYKNPITDDGSKISACGLLNVGVRDGEYVMTDNVTWLEEEHGELKTTFLNGKLIKDFTLAEIRETLNKK